MTPLQQLAERGQSVWIDYLSRKFVKDGDLKRLVEQGVVGVTSNPTIFQGAIAEGDAYDDQIRELSAEIDEPKEIFWQLAKDDIRDACDILRPVWDEGDGKDGWVSLEVDPNLAHDTEGTIEEAKRLHAWVDRPNLFIKIPATKAGLPAIEETIAAGIPVNVTLIFSLERHREETGVYPERIEDLLPRYLRSVPLPRAGWLPSQDETFLYTLLGDSFLLEFPGVVWVQCAYSPPYREALDEDELEDDEEEPWERTAPGAEPAPPAGLRGAEVEVLGASWSCESKPPRLW